MHPNPVFRQESEARAIRQSCHELFAGETRRLLADAVQRLRDQGLAEDAVLWLTRLISGECVGPGTREMEHLGPRTDG